MKSITRKPRKNALEGDGPIVDRARQALHQIAAQFGEVSHRGRTRALVTTSDGIDLVLEYEPGNYVFSRVYNLRIKTTLPSDTAVPAGLGVSYRGADAPAFVSEAGLGKPRGEVRAPVAERTAPTAVIDALNTIVRDHLRGVDLVSSRVEIEGGRRVLHLTPMGGSFVWVLIPPIFKATAFPSGEPGRILELVRALRGFTIAATTPKGHHA
ncbi:hypothetical protein LWF01_10615 [Saxibacter everestensis]|uniref:DUF3156 family protein n=1 Tax=Saxibacter everestensis TaxID=2909229 RepID=A0ABY8QNQ5_9MICO|nr:hypothetical protein LWF01_10615 [Brevibacteriaceae bacterium ZFBP1038]